jgi:small subunit ribosomal protein S6
MYILASSVSDDQLPEVTGQILGFVTDFGGTDVQETQLGKKKLAYPIKKTRNGFYGVVDFTMDAKKVNDLDAKIRTQDNTIIRYLLVNMDEHLERSAKDADVQAKMNRNRPAEVVEAERAAAAGLVPEPAKAPAKQSDSKPAEKPAPAMSETDLDEEIEKALTEDLTK